MLHRHYQTISLLGSGTSAVIVSAIHLHTNTLVAIKIVRRQTDYFRNAQKEIQVLKLFLNQIHLVQLVDTFVFEGHQCIVLEYFPYSLRNCIDHQILDDCEIQQKHRIVKKIALQLLSALQTMQRCDEKVLHRDIKPENILMNLNYDVKLADFGSACFSDSSDETNTFYIQSRFYRAPEVILGIEYSEAIE